jgi:tetraacyldisaccharide 4'-kinase
MKGKGSVRSQPVRSGLSKVYGLALKGKEFLYQAGFADVIDLPVPVLSVGNLSVGGTGKTPVTDFLLREAERHGLKTLVVSRNYKAASHGIHRVDIHKKNGAQYFGDEAFWLAKRHPHFAVYVGPVKVWTAAQAVKENETDLVIVDDGFQHRGLHRDFDCVLLDATAGEGTERLLPAGRFREDFSALKRAELVIITKANWAKPERVAHLKSKIPAGVETVEMDFRLKLSRMLPPQATVLAFCGIARPEIFQSQLEELSHAQSEAMTPNFEIKKFVNFPDHYSYSAKDLKGLLKAADLAGCEKILTTEKDYVKVAAFAGAEARERMIAVEMTAELKDEPRTLNDFFDKLSGL